MACIHEPSELVSAARVTSLEEQIAEIDKVNTELTNALAKLTAALAPVLSPPPEGKVSVGRLVDTNMSPIGQKIEEVICVERNIVYDMYELINRLNLKAS